MSAIRVLASRRWSLPGGLAIACYDYGFTLYDGAQQLSRPTLGTRDTDIHWIPLSHNK